MCEWKVKHGQRLYTLQLHFFLPLYAYRLCICKHACACTCLCFILICFELLLPPITFRINVWQIRGQTTFMFSNTSWPPIVYTFSWLRLIVSKSLPSRSYFLHRKHWPEFWKSWFQNITYRDIFCSMLDMKCNKFNSIFVVIGINFMKVLIN